MREYLDQEFVNKIIKLQGDITDKQKILFDEYLSKADLSQNADLVGIIMLPDGSEALTFLYERKVTERIEFKRKGNEDWKEIQYEKSISKLHE